MWVEGAGERKNAAGAVRGFREAQPMSRKQMKMWWRFLKRM
jgi:hypothetical protein